VIRVSDVPAVVGAYRKGHIGVPLEKLVDAYYDSLEKMQASKKDAAARLRYAMMCLSFLEPLIKYTKKEWGEVPPSIPAIYEASIFHAINGAEGQLKNILDLVSFFPETRDYRAGVEEGFVILKLARQIRKHLEENPGILQNKLKKALDFDDGRLLSRVVHYMEVAGQLERRKHEKTHELYLKVHQQERQSATTPSRPSEPNDDPRAEPQKKRRWWQRDQNT